MSVRHYYLSALWRMSIVGTIAGVALLLSGAPWWGGVTFALLLIGGGMLKAFERLYWHRKGVIDP